MSRWTEKPPIGSQINWNHPLSKGLVGAWLMNEGAGNKVINLADNTITSLTNGATFKKTVGINGISDNNTNLSGFSFTATDKYKVNNPTVIWSGSILGACNVGTPLLGISYSNNDSSPYVSYLITKRNNTTAIGCEWNNVGIGKSNTPTNIDYGKKLQCILRINSNGFTFDINNNRITTSVDTGTINFSSTSQVVLMRHESAARSCNAITEYGYIWNIPLPDNALKSLYEAPYQFIYKPRRVFYSIPTGVTTWGHKIYGINNANIGKVNQIDKSNINKVNNA